MRDNTPSDEDEIGQISELMELNELVDLDEVTVEEFSSGNESDDMMEGLDEDIEDDAFTTFVKHSKPVFGLSVNPKYPLAASGDQNDIAYVWNTKTQQVYVEINHKDTVTQVAFSYDGKYLATGDMAGNIVVYKITEETNEYVNNNENDDDVDNAYKNGPFLEGLAFGQVFKISIEDIEKLVWHFGANILFAATNEGGEIYMWHIPSGECKIMPGVGSSAILCDVTADGKKLACVYENGMMKLWDAKACQAIYTYFNNDENDLIEPQSIAVSKHSPIFAAGDLQGKIFFYTYTQYIGRVQAEGGVESMSFVPESTGLKVCISCTLAGQIVVWDYARLEVRNIIQQVGNESISSMVLMTDYLFAVGTLIGELHVYDIRKEETLCTLRGHRGTIYNICYDDKNKLLYTASEDKTVRIFQPNVETS